MLISKSSVRKMVYLDLTDRREHEFQTNIRNVKLFPLRKFLLKIGPLFQLQQSLTNLLIELFGNYPVLQRSHAISFIVA
jgi:hypothetical protein